MISDIEVDSQRVYNVVVRRAAVAGFFRADTTTAVVFLSVNYLSDSSKRPCCRGPAYDYVVNTL